MHPRIAHRRALLARAKLTPSRHHLVTKMVEGYALRGADGVIDAFKAYRPTDLRHDEMLAISQIVRGLIGTVKRST